MKKEKYNLNESNIKFKQENDNLYKTIENQNFEINSLERKNTDLEEQINEYKENFELKGKDFINLIVSEECKIEIKKKKLNYQNLFEQKNKVNTKLEILLDQKTKENQKLENLLEQKREENEQLEETIEGLKKDLEDANNEIDENNSKLEMIEKVINYGIKLEEKEDKYNYSENKYLLIYLILSNQTGYITTDKVALSMLEVDRKDFSLYNPYQDRPQQIGYHVNISAPHMHALALEWLSDFCTEDAKILDIGSGSGYLTCALSALTNYKGTVVGVDHIQELVNWGIKNVGKKHRDLLNKKKIIFVNSDGRYGYKALGPYKAIHVGAAVEQIPNELLDQLDYEGRMFIPVGKINETQYINIVDKSKSGVITYRKILSVCYGMLTDVDEQLNPQ